MSWNCPSCGSDRYIPPEVVSFEHGGGTYELLNLHVIVNADLAGHHAARADRRAQVAALICGRCGHLELRAIDAPRLYAQVFNEAP